MKKLVNSDYSDEYTKVGATINVRRPVQFEVRSGAVANMQAVQEVTVPVTMDQQIGVDFELTNPDDDPRFNESAFAQSVADRYNTDHRLETVSGEDFNLVDTLAWLYDEPFADSSSIACLALARALGDRYRVILNGDGGDEAFAEELAPNVVHGDTRRQRVLSTHKPLGEVEACAAGGLRQYGERAGLHFLRRLEEIATMEQMNGIGLSESTGKSHLPRRGGGDFRLQRLALGEHRVGELRDDRVHLRVTAPQAFRLGALRVVREELRSRLQEASKPLL